MAQQSGSPPPHHFRWGLCLLGNTSSLNFQKEQWQRGLTCQSIHVLILQARKERSRGNKWGESVVHPNHECKVLDSRKTGIPAPLPAPMHPRSFPVPHQH